ncbi:prolyl 4-hydroxylase, beta polypeptide [Talaromyces islandicus]|uniref:Protein disulfide-isomerase n=1 Tax=Talaromyces islandicus TaxID=28573 RepID=A0A0U1M8D3_TALIS|nr:prolyl 4-hydroxylase, beta polypeptide [Talaromyces islandicus]
MLLKARLSSLVYFLSFFYACFTTADPQAINAKGFEERSLTQGIFIVAFCMPWFEPCKSLNAELVHAEESFGKTSKVDVYEFDCSKEERFCSSLEVLSFPTIRIFNQRKWTRYRGRQKAQPIVSHVLKQVMDPVIKLDEQNFSVMKNLDRPLMVLAHREDDDASLDLMNSLAQQELSNLAFVGEIGVDSPLITGLATDRKPPFITVVSALDETTPVYDGPFEKDQLLEFSNKVSSPLIRPLQIDNIIEFMQSGIPLAMIFSVADAERKSIARNITNIAMRYRGKVNFVTVDAEKHSFTLDPLGLDAGSLPAFAIQTNDNVFKLNRDLNKNSHDAIEELIQQSLRSVKLNVQ